MPQSRIPQPRHRVRKNDKNEWLKHKWWLFCEQKNEKNYGIHRSVVHQNDACHTFRFHHSLWEVKIVQKKRYRDVSNTTKRRGYLLAIALLVALFYPNLFGSDDGNEIPFQDFREKVIAGEITEAEFNNNNGKIKATTLDNESIKSSGPIELSSEDADLFLGNIPAFEYNTPGSNIWILPMKETSKMSLIESSQHSTSNIRQVFGVEI